MEKILLICLALMHVFFNASTSIASSQEIELPECIVMTHCVKENWEVSDVEESFKKAVELVSKTPRTRIVEKNETFIHAEAKTKWRRYTDDLLIKSLPKKGIIQVRSESRLGVGDNGVNQKRIDKLSYRLMTK
ncbi:DUF1499 domain-containing protein [Prochlorococcus sp. MIT 1307]|uniref:DUF1499 domain-containing protein n=1 Tax=Prochlorococcus sp. MIT 1307 TaxID=3096219 RepID=UPI002A75FFB2|nr:DUF1499 domain-containing protein [Prochlorococcus sp. MIT 1307]